MDDNKTVNHPSHYSGCGMECIETMLIAFGAEATIIFCMMNAYKYLWRAPNKNGEEDLLKAQWYVDYADHIGVQMSSTKWDCKLAQLHSLVKHKIKERLVKKS